MAAEQRTYENLIATERAISAIKRQQPLPPLEFSNALFLSALKHCNEQRGLARPELLTNISDENGNLIGKRRPSTAAADFATDLSGVEMNVAVGKNAVDMVVKSFMAPESRSILLNPMSRYTGIATCTNEFGAMMSI